MRCFSVLFAVCLILSSCQKDGLPGNYTIEFGQTIIVDGNDFRMSFAQVLEDSRCPVDVTCFWEGQVRVMLVLSEAENSDSLELIHRSGHPELAKGTYKGWTIELLKVIPTERYVDREVKLEDYKLELKVE